MSLYAADLRGRPDELVRFSDETSLDSRSTQGQKVPIYATVPRDADISWYHDLLRRFPDAPELKSANALAALESLPSELVERIWRGLRLVSVHIADPRQYVDQVDEWYREATGHEFPRNALLGQRRLGDPIAVHYMGWLERATASLMLDDSIPERLRDLVDDAARRSMIFSVTAEDARRLRLDDLKVRKGSVLRRVAEYAAKGSAAFAPAHDLAVQPPNRYELRQFWAGATSFDLVLRGTLRELEDGHAFDRGDARTLDQLEAERRIMAGQLLETGFVEVEVVYEPNDGRSLIEGESKEEARIQAADIAAGLARYVLARQGLAEVVRRWDVVYYNGARITENNLDAVLRFWSSLPQGAT